MTADAPSPFGAPVRWVGERIRSQSRSTHLLLVPLALFEMVFFVAPFLILVRTSLYRQSSEGFFEAGWTLQAYLDVLTSDVTLSIIAFSFELGVVATVISVIVGLFYAYAIVCADGLPKAVLLFSVVLPLLTTLVVKTYAWVPLLTPEGLVNEVLLSLGLVAEPVWFVPGLVGTVVGQVYIVLPYCVLAIYSVLSTLDWSVVEAARDLGASRPRSFYEVVLPAAMPGVAVAAVVSFAWSVGAYTAPSLLGSGPQTTFAMTVDTLTLTEFNWPLASALSLLMLVTMLVVSLTLFDRLGGAGGGVRGG